jgi:lysophospholipase L1-like esterase
MNNSSQKTYLALGDSYTIGECVAITESFPYQTVQLLRKAGHSFRAPEIIAKTGWTTDELQQGIKNNLLLPAYDLVTLLIGVNNQYRERNTEEYSRHFENLLENAIDLANGKPQHVFVLSIPDWGVTPFAVDRNRSAISTAVDQFNKINKVLTEKFACHYVDITAGTREAATDESLLADDKLHPSGKEYARWAEKLFIGIVAGLRESHAAMPPP